MEGRIMIGTNPQAFRLQEVLEEKGVVHGDVVRGDIEAVCIGKLVFDESISIPKDAHSQPVFFCNVTEFRMRDILQKGNGGEFPERVEIHNLHVVDRGFVNINNAIISVNGAISITVDEESEVVPYKGE